MRIERPTPRFYGNVTGRRNLNVTYTNGNRLRQLTIVFISKIVVGGTKALGVVNSPVNIPINDLVRVGTSLTLASDIAIDDYFAVTVFIAANDTYIAYAALDAVGSSIFLYSWFEVDL